MNCQELFEHHYAATHLQEVDKIKAQRMGTDSYRLPAIASSWRMFRAGFEAKEGELLRVSIEGCIDSPHKCLSWEQAKAPGKPHAATGGVDLVGESGSRVAESRSIGAKLPSSGKFLTHDELTEGWNRIFRELIGGI